MTLSQALDEILPTTNTCMACEQAFYAVNGEEVCSDCLHAPVLIANGITT